MKSIAIDRMVAVKSARSFIGGEANAVIIEATEAVHLLKAAKDKAVADGDESFMNGTYKITIECVPGPVKP